MYVFKNKILCDSDGNYIYSVKDEIILTRDIVEDYLTIEDMEKAIRNYYTVPLFRLYLLNPDETIKEDVTSLIVGDELSYTDEYKTGQRRSASATVRNDDGSWFPNPVKGRNWSGVKFQLYMGLIYNEVVFWFPAGVYYLSNPSLSMGEDNASFELTDKFSMLDGTLGGTTETDYKINVNDLVCDSIATLLRLDIGNGEKFDEKRFIYPYKYNETKTPYTLEKNPESNIGEIITELSEMLSCEVAYDSDGHLEMLPADELLAVEEKPVMLHITDRDIDVQGVTINIDYTKIINKVTVVGSNINGKIFKHTATNNNPSSPSSIIFTPPNFKYISDDNINSDDLCKERAEYELQKGSFLGMTISVPLHIWTPFLEAGNLITWTSEKYGFKAEKFLVNSVNISGNGDISLSIANIKELPF